MWFSAENYSDTPSGHCSFAYATSAVYTGLEMSFGPKRHGNSLRYVACVNKMWCGRSVGTPRLLIYALDLTFNSSLQRLWRRLDVMENGVR